MKNEEIKRSLSIIIIMFVLISNSGKTWAVSLPESLIIIEEEAFAGDASLYELALPRDIKEIRSRAFANTQLYSILLPQSLNYIAGDAFQGVTTPLLIETEPGSISVQYALSHQLDFRADTVLRALLIGQSKYPGTHELSGPEKDISTMSGCLSNDYEITVCENVSVEQILTAISESFAEATDEDISLFYYSGHGFPSKDSEMNGALIGIDFASYLTAAQLRNVLDSIPGRKIVLVDACYSGALIGKGGKKVNSTSESTDNEQIESEIEDPATSFINTFINSPHIHLRSLAAQPYYVLTASKSNEQSWESNTGGVFTQSFSKSRSEADYNGDGIVSFLECYKYTAKEVSDTVATGGLKQSVQAYPDNCFWFGIFR